MSNAKQEFEKMIQHAAIGIFDNKDVHLSDIEAFARQVADFVIDEASSSNAFISSDYSELFRDSLKYKIFGEVK